MANRFDIIENLKIEVATSEKEAGRSFVSLFGEELFRNVFPFAQQPTKPENAKEFGSIALEAGLLALPIGKIVKSIPKTAITEIADTALSRLVNAIKEAKPIRKGIEKLASLERARRAGAAAGVLEKAEGESAFIRAKGQLKGELVSEKPAFEPLRAKVPELEPLAQEARKYKSAEEFVKTQEPNKLLHLTDKSNVGSIEKQGLRSTAATEGKITDGISLTTKRTEANEIFGNAEVSVYVRPDAKRITLKEALDKMGFADETDIGVIKNVETEAPAWARENGYDILDMRGARGAIYKGMDEIRVLNPDVVKTKSQLTDFYNQAVKGVKVAPEITAKLAQGDIDTLFIQIQRHPDLSVYDKISAADGFSQLLRGEIPQPSKLSLLEDVFGKDLIKETLNKRPALDKLKDLATEVLNIPRSLLASFDMSAPLRQGVFFIGKPKSVAKAGYQMFRQAFSEKNYVQWLDDVKKTPEYKLMQDSGLYLADPRRVSGGLAAREERFMSQLAEKIPIIGQGIKAAERAYTSYLNKLRTDVFVNISNKFQKMGLSPKENPDLYESLGAFVNNATGRGDLGKFNGIAQQLNTLFFSPRLIASRFNMLNPVWYAKQHPLVRKEAIKSFAEFVGIGTTILTMAKMGGADVEVDPRSTDFGKIRVGNTRWDIWGGFQQWVRVFSQMALKARKTQKGEIVELSKKKFPFETRFDVGLRFFRGKLAPVPSLALELFEGSKLFGEEIKPTQEVIENTIPLYLQDIGEAFEQLGPSTMISVGVPAFFGVGVQTYEEKKKEGRFNF